jgi:Predicted permeases
MAILNVIIPVCLIFLIGYIGQKIFCLNIKSVSTVSLYLIAPALMFQTFYETKLNYTFLQIVIYVVILSVVIIWLMKGIGFIRKYSPSVTSGLILATAFMNNGNFGAPVVLFAYGEKGFQYAVIILTLHVMFISTFGVYYAAKGKMDIKGSLLSILKMPMIWGSVAGLLWQYLNIPLPENMYNAISLVADAAIPTIMITLGMQLAELKPDNLQWGKISLSLIIRLIISPVIAWAIAWCLGTEILLMKVMIVSAAMPAAAITTMYALQYDSEPDLVSSITLFGTLLSVITLSILLTLLG